MIEFPEREPGLPVAVLTTAQVQRVAKLLDELYDDDSKIGEEVRITGVPLSAGYLFRRLIHVTLVVWPGDGSTGGGRDHEWLIDGGGKVIAHRTPEDR